MKYKMPKQNSSCITRNYLIGLAIKRNVYKRWDRTIPEIPVLSYHATIEEIVDKIEKYLKDNNDLPSGWFENHYPDFDFAMSIYNYCYPDDPYKYNLF
jgi:hypothetical protein